MEYQEVNEYQALKRGWGAVIAAAGEADPSLAAACGAKYKSLAILGGKPAVSYVLDACRLADLDQIAVVGQPEVIAALGELRENELTAQPGDSPFSSARNGLQQLHPALKVFFLPSDSPLISWFDLNTFQAKIDKRLWQNQSERWFAAGLSPKSEVQKHYPNAPYKYLRFFGERFASGALYAASRPAVEHAIEILERSIANRKSQLRLAWQFGLINLGLYLSGLMSLARAEKRAGRLLGGEAFIIPTCHPRTTLDFDDVADWQFLKDNFERLRLEKT